jgi:hypothetical protein
MDTSSTLTKFSTHAVLRLIPGQAPTKEQHDLLVEMRGRAYTDPYVYPMGDKMKESVGSYVPS